jgi:hypothetical protein
VVGPLLAPLLGGAAVLLLASAAPLAGQEPRDTVPRPDTLRLDTLRVDTLVVDSLPGPPDGPQEDVPDSLQVRTMPRLGGLAPGRPEAGALVWDRDGLLALPGFTLLELLERIPGLVPLRYGDYGAPEGVVGPGLTGGRIRVFIDGFESVPLDGSIPDLSRVSLGALSEVRVERAAGELRLHLTTLRPDDARPISLVEVGTGDLDTNFFRGTFLHPRALGGSIGVSLERLDTEGPGRDESGSRQAMWLRYGVHLGDRFGLAFELRRGTGGAELEGIPPKATRTDWVVRGRAVVVDGLVAEAYTGVGRIRSDPDSLTPLDGERRQHGVRLGLAKEHVWARAEGRLLSGPKLPEVRVDLGVGGRLPGIAGAALDWSADGWAGRRVTARGVRAWTEPFFGVSAFGSYESGLRGARVFEPRDSLPSEDDLGEGEEEEPEPEPEEPGPTHRIGDATTMRVGARVAVGPFDLVGAWLRTEVDSILPLGILADREGVPVPGDEVTGFEVSGRLAISHGFALVGSLLQWEDEGVYRPRRVYQGGLDFHDVFYPTGNLEIWSGLQVEGRDPMLLPFVVGEGEGTTYQRVPFYQSWQFHLQIRIQTVRIFYRLENAFLRRNNQDVPDRILPSTRSMYGVRWVLWN